MIIDILITELYSDDYRYSDYRLRSEYKILDCQIRFLYSDGYNIVQYDKHNIIISFNIINIKIFYKII